MGPGATAEMQGVVGSGGGGGGGEGMADVVGGVQRLELDGGGTERSREGEELDRAFGGRQ